MVPAKNCFVCPEENQFIQDKKTKQWFKVADRGFKYIKASKVLQSNKQKTANKPANKTTATASNKTAATDANKTTATDANKTTATAANKTAATADEPAAAAPDPATLTSARRVIKNKNYIAAFIKYWVSNQPDVTDMPDIKPSALLFWKKHNTKDHTKAHRLFPG